MAGAATFKEVRKRDGRIVPFDEQRIASAVVKAMRAAEEGVPDNDAQTVADEVTRGLLKKFHVSHVPGIEEIQDVVEATLISLNFPKTAKAYIIYRSERSKTRADRREVPDRVRELVEESKKYFKNSLGEFVYYRTYARWIEDEQRRETWVETVDRYMNFMRENVGGKLTEAEYTEVREYILQQKAMPSMRLMQFAGKAARATNVCAYNCSFIAPSKIRDFGEIMYISMCGTGVGFSVESQNVQALPQIKMQSGEKLDTHVIPDSKEGWADALILGMETWFDGKDIEFDYSNLRPAGARLNTMGGKSSGPEPLKSLLEFTRAKILRRQGRRLTNLDAHDIVCKVGSIVVSGGVRRSALISLSDLDDHEMRDAKNGQFYLTEPQRSIANNSAVYTQKPTNAEFLEEWISLMKSGTGERGIFYRGGLKKTLPERRLKISDNYIDSFGTNPCVPSDTWVTTNEGAKQVKDLIGLPFTAIVEGKEYPSKGFFKTGDKETFLVNTDRGFQFEATNNHRVLTVAYKTRKVERREWKEVKDLKTGDKVVLHDHKTYAWEGIGTEEEGWLLGNLLGDGNIEKNGKANLDYWGATQSAMLAHAREAVHATVGGRSDLVGHIAKTGYARLGSKNLGTLAESYGMQHGSKHVTELIEQSSSSFYEGFLRGWFDADGSVQGTQEKGTSVRLSSNSEEDLLKAQRMLARLGIIATLYRNRREAQLRELPDGQGGTKFYWCEANHELVIASANLARFKNRVGFNDPKKQTKLEEVLSTYRREMNSEPFSTTITEITPSGVKEVYDCSVPNANAFDGNGILLHNCGEIILRSRQFCNLTEVIARAEDTEETLLQKTRVATILGTYQSTLTNFVYLSEEWKKNCEEERLLGVSITGQWDSTAVRNASTLRKMKELAIKTNEEYAKRLGVTQSTCITCVKPSGTVSKTFDTASGMHTRHAPYYIQRIRISATDALFKMLKDQGVPYHPEVGQAMDSANTYVIEFPVKAPDGAICKDDLTAIQQLEYWKLVKRNYTEHNPSVTISIGEDEWITVASWLYENWDMIGGLSFLPRSNHVYQLAPYEATTKEKYDEMVARLGDIDFSKIVAYEKQDETEVRKELACVSGVCEIEEIPQTNSTTVTA